MRKLMATLSLFMLYSFILGLIVFGCSVHPDAIRVLPTITPPVEAMPTSTAIPAVNSKPSITAMPTVTAQPHTLSPTSTPWTPTIFPTKIVVPTLPPEALKKNLIELFSTNGGCDFPCWWGVSPGDSIDKVFSLSTLLGEAPGREARGGYFYYTISIVDPYSPDLEVNFYYSPAEVIRDMEVIIIYPSRFTKYNDAIESQLALHNLLSRYGKPNAVLLLVEPRVEPNSPISYALFLGYEEQRFGIEYSGVIDAENPVQICSIKLEDYHLEYVQLFMQDIQPVIIERNQYYLNDFRPLDEVTSMSLDDFYEAYSDANYSGCIETSYELWK